jgi:hypothetical protein
MSPFMADCLPPVFPTISFSPIECGRGNAVLRLALVNFYFLIFCYIAKVDPFFADM